MAQEIRTIEVRGTSYEVVREGLDWFVYYPGDQVYIGKAIFRPHRRDGPFIAYFLKKQVGDSLETLDDAVDLIDRNRGFLEEEEEAAEA